MARNRNYGEDLTFAEWHRKYLPEQYARIGHRLDLANRDWTEFCHHCKLPLAILEEVVDRGQNLNEKATTVTRNLAKMADVDAYLIAPRIDRPREVQNEIDQLNARIRELEAQNPIVEFHLKELYPQHSSLKSMTPTETAEFFLVLHRRHHEQCMKAKAQGEFASKRHLLRQAMERHGLFNRSAKLFG